MNTVSRLAATLVGASIIVTLGGCSHSGTTTSSGTPTASATTSAGQSTSPSSPPVTSPTSPQVPQQHGVVGGIDVTINASGPTTVQPGGAPMPFSVTLANITPADIAQVGMVVSLGHCSCNPSGAAMMPAGTMQMLDPNTKAWVTVPYVAEGTGTDFLSRTLVPPFVLTQGQTITYQLQLQLNANQGFAVGKGDSTINVTMTNVTTNTPLGVGPTASLPITVGP